VHYDPMLAKVISFADSRAEAAHLLASALTRAEIHGVVTNRDLLVRVLRHDAFLAGDTDTSFFAAYGLEELSQPICDESAAELSAVAAALADAANNRASAAVNGRAPAGWRNVAGQPQSKSFTASGDRFYDIRYRRTRSGIQVDGHEGLAVVETTPNRVVLDVPAEHALVRRTFAVARYGDQVCVDSRLGPAQGDSVSAGQPILWMEAMKMEHTIAAPAAGTLTVLNVDIGQQVEVGAILAIVDIPAEES